MPNPTSPQAEDESVDFGASGTPGEFDTITHIPRLSLAETASLTANATMKNAMKSLGVLACKRARSIMAEGIGTLAALLAKCGTDAGARIAIEEHMSVLEGVDENIIDAVLVARSHMNKSPDDPDRKKHARKAQQILINAQEFLAVVRNKPIFADYVPGVLQLLYKTHLQAALIGVPRDQQAVIRGSFTGLIRPLAQEEEPSLRDRTQGRTNFVFGVEDADGETR